MSAAPIAAPKETGMLLDADAKKKLREMGVKDLVKFTSRPLALPA